MRVVVDANVFVSAILTVGTPPAKVVDAWLSGRIELVTSPEIIEEIKKVLSYPKIRKRTPFSDEEIAELIELISIRSIKVTGSLELRVIEADPTDDKYLAAAVEGKADYIVTGDSHLKDLGEYEGVKIVSPSEFMRIIEEIT